MRYTATYTVADEGRDKGKMFLITEMLASQGEAWASQALMALMQANVEMPDDFENLGMAGLAQMGFQCLSRLQWDVTEPLLKEMFECVQIVPDPRKPAVIRPLMGDNGDYDIEEISTRFKLRIEVFKLHTSFLRAVAPSLFEKVKAANGKASRTAASAKS
jgi:hypothetical protein